ncbi:MAG TPA: hypothetical protein VE914_13465 [Candidatus Angelobacter sp.]|nr:hypothetical protein [Candidatus Angelobacter sp.]
MERSTMIPQLTWADLRGEKYTYSVFGFDQEWVDFPANYIFARCGHYGWEALYIGETDSLKMCINKRHEAWTYCRNRGAIHVLVHFNFAGRAARQVEEQALILAYNPPGNNPERGSYVRLPDFRKSA